MEQPIKINEETNKYFEILESEESSIDQRVEALINLSNFFVDKDFADSFKYASMATIVTDIPRADACCCLGDRYLMANNIKWAKIWYRHALDDALRVGCDCKYWTYLPLIKFAQIDFLKENYDSALNLVEALLLMRKDDTEILELKDIILSKMGKK